MIHGRRLRNRHLLRAGLGPARDRASSPLLDSRALQALKRAEQAIGNLLFPQAGEPTQTHETTGLEIQVDYALEDRLPAYLEVLIYRLVQEALTNVRKHARATSATLSIETDESAGTVIVRVADDGRGFDSAAKLERAEGYGVGLRSMRERMEGAGGEMRVESAPGRGTTITFVLPLPDEVEERS